MLSTLYVCICFTLTHCMGIYTHTYQFWSKDSIDGPKDHLSITGSSNDQHGHRRIILRCLMVELWSNHIFRAPRRISCILRGYPSIQTTSCCPSQTRRIVDLVNLQTDFGHRLHTDRIQTKYRHKCTNSAAEP
ncbi:hypothetical protein HanRHA438_Chr09g0381061 [Helianthus annuus]|nr:hypothetical protein HanHA300_Chr09g0303841 [Helianthus annuus]KAJ0541031.1 hypothetical protein HanHA89_Chr09g0323841 [Helianthus annuus]KAJ0706118.1 hypothetical protein HanLR1_Chr09g0303381 [Helianthus annuus]KAJ0886579.1 hypothetical protein HanRHA438_Chr09g0381061 [Helianthus annuus]